MKILILDRLLQNSYFFHFSGCNSLILSTLNFEKCSSVTACRNTLLYSLRLKFLPALYSEARRGEHANNFHVFDQTLIKQIIFKCAGIKEKAEKI